MGFRRGALKGKFACFEAYKCPIPERRKLLAKRPFYKQRGPVLNALSTGPGQFFHSWQKRTPKPKNRTNSAKEFSEQFEGGYRSMPIKTRVLRRIAPESSPESSAESLSQKFFGVPFLSLIDVPNRGCTVRSGSNRTDLQRFKIAWFESQPQLPFDSLDVFTMWTFLKIGFKSRDSIRAIRFASRSWFESRAPRHLSRGGWREEISLCQRFRPPFCTLLPIPP